MAQCKALGYIYGADLDSIAETYILEANNALLLNYINLINLVTQFWRLQLHWKKIACF